MSQVVTELNRRWKEEQVYSHGMKSGVVANTYTKLRYFYLSSELIESYYEVLKYEVGDAWHDVMRICGYHWGTGMHDSMMTEIASVPGYTPASFTINDFFKYMNTCFRSNGLGSITFDDAYAREGILFVTIKNGFSYTAIRARGETKDGLSSGFLEGLFCKISEQEVSCIQLDQQRKSSSEVTFVISGKQRAEAHQERLAQIDKTTEAVALLNGSV